MSTNLFTCLFVCAPTLSPSVDMNRDIDIMVAVQPQVRGHKETYLTLTRNGFLSTELAQNSGLQPSNCLL